MMLTVKLWGKLCIVTEIEKYRKTILASQVTTIIRRTFIQTKISELSLHYLD